MNVKRNLAIFYSSLANCEKNFLDIKFLLVYSISMKLNTEKIYRELSRLGWKKSRLAKELGITRQGVHYYLSSKPTVWKVEKLADVLGLDAKDLLS